MVNIAVPSTADDVATTGFALIPNVLDADLPAPPVMAGIPRAGLRNLLDRFPEIRTLACTPAIRRLVEPILGSEAFAVNATLFDKTPEVNWKVPWHQDLTIAVQRRIDAPGFGPWSVKDGVPHVQPPVAVLENMLAVRIHLDHCGEDNGPLRVIPGSHRCGRLNDAQIQSMRNATPSISLPVDRGGVLLMRPLLLHASSAASSPARRRVIHIEFACGTLPAGLKWYYAAT